MLVDGIVAVQAFHGLSMLESVNVGAGGLLDKEMHRDMQNRVEELRELAFGSDAMQNDFDTRAMPARAIQLRRMTEKYYGGSQHSDKS